VWRDRTVTAAAGILRARRVRAAGRARVAEDVVAVRDFLAVVLILHGWLLSI
jgi:hypothetical protein